MDLRLRTSSALRPLATPARELSHDCAELWIATAFVSDAALSDVVKSALDNGARVRFLTGTFGNVTRLRTFKRLWDWSKRGQLDARVWPGDFHAKLALWRGSRSACCWIGSANLTDRGLQNDGELVAEISGRWDDARFRAVRRSFNAEWSRARALDADFLKTYREAPRVASLLTGRARTPPRARRTRVRSGRALLVVSIGFHYADDSAVAQRVTARLAGTDTWYRSRNRVLQHVKAGQHCLLADGVDKTLRVAVVTDTAKDGNARVIAYEPLKGSGERSSTRRLRMALEKLGMQPTSKAFRTQWLDPDVAGDVIGTIFGSALRKRFDREISGS